MSDHFSFPDRPTLKRQPFVYSLKEDPDTIYEVSRPEGGKFGEVTVRVIKQERGQEEAQQEREQEIQHNLGIPSGGPVQEHCIVRTLSAPARLASIGKQEEGKNKEATREDQRQADDDFILMGKKDPIDTQVIENPSADRILYSQEKVTIPYDPGFYPGIEYPNKEVEIPQEGHFIAGTQTLNKFSEELLENMVHLIQGENRANTPYHQLRRDLERATFYLEEKGNKKLLFAEDSSSPPTQATAEAEVNEEMGLQPAMTRKDQAIYNLEFFVGNPVLARVIGSTLHQTLFTFLPDITSHPEIVGLPRPSSQSEEGIQAKIEYTLEKKQASGSSKPVFIITATSTADVESFTFKDQSNGQLATFIFTDPPPGRSLNFKQTASIAITLELRSNDQFDPKKPWDKENFPCQVKCLGYINIYNSIRMEPVSEQEGETSSSKKLFDTSAKFASDVSEKMSSASSAAAVTFQNLSEQASRQASRFGSNFSNARGVIARGAGGILDKGKQLATSFRKKEPGEH